MRQTPIDVAVVARNGAVDHRTVFRRRIGILGSDREIVPAGYRDGQRRLIAGAIFVGDGVVRDDVDDLAFSQGLVGLV